jgi:hypothetical protein
LAQYQATVEPATAIGHRGASAQSAIFLGKGALTNGPEGCSMVPFPRSKRKLTGGTDMPTRAKFQALRHAEVLRNFDDFATSANQLQELCARILASRQKLCDLVQQSKQEQEPNPQSFNLQFLELQNQMSDESKQFSAVSNIMKTKRDTTKNSISNLR